MRALYSQRRSHQPVNLLDSSIQEQPCIPRGTSERILFQGSPTWLLAAGFGSSPCRPLHRWLQGPHNKEACDTGHLLIGYQPCWIRWTHFSSINSCSLFISRMVCPIKPHSTGIRNQLRTQFNWTLEKA